MDRRSFVHGGTAAVALGLMAWASRAALAQDAGGHPAAPSNPFSREWLIEEARRLAASPYEDRTHELPAELLDLTYDQYRDIRYRAEARIWGSENLPFTLDLFHPGFYFRLPVHVFVVEGSTAREIEFSPDLFEYGPSVSPPQGGNLGFSGFRVRNKINTPDFWDEFLVFQGASYFRAVGRNQFYGLSARGLAINTAEPEGEEFPAFIGFWIERPDPTAAFLVAHALLDSPSTSGAFTFSITPGAETVMEVDAAIFPREEIRKLGIAPLTSMFMFDSTNRGRFDDFRPAVHDSNGLQMLTGAGEWLWRPLGNSAELQISAFMDRTPRGFGLIQRSREFEDFEDLEAKYERRPSLWIEPLGDWGNGAVELVEIPTDSEANDNIVAFWRPNGPVPAGGPWNFSYRMRWTDIVRPENALLITVATRIGKTMDQARELIVVDFGGPEPIDPKVITAEPWSSAGKILNAVVHGILPTGALRVSFELDPEDNPVCELRLRLITEGRPASETWLYRWIAE